MLNEILFLSQICVIGMSASLAKRFGREALVVLMCVLGILSNLFVGKQIVLFGLAATCSDSFSVGCSLCLNLLQENFGKDVAKKAIWLSFGFLVFYLAMTQFQIFYTPSQFDFLGSCYEKILSLMPRLVLASLTAYFISQQTDRLIFGYLTEQAKVKNFILKNYASLLISQLIDTILFSLLGLYGVVSNISQIILISYLIKIGTIILIAPLTKLAND